MNRYYFLIKENLITGYGQCPCASDGCICLEVTEEQYNNAKDKGDNYYIYQNDEIVLNPNYEEEQAQKEQERVGNLTMTALDFINFLQEKGLTLEQINAYLESNLQVKMQLTYCQNVYCGVATALMPISVGDITITKDDVIQAFKNKNGENIDEDTTDSNLEL